MVSWNFPMFLFDVKRWDVVENDVGCAEAGVIRVDPLCGGALAAFVKVFAPISAGLKLSGDPPVPCEYRGIDLHG